MTNALDRNKTPDHVALRVMVPTASALGCDQWLKWELEAGGALSLGSWNRGVARIFFGGSEGLEKISGVDKIDPKPVKLKLLKVL